MDENDVHTGYGYGIVRSYATNCTTKVNRDSGRLAQKLLVWYSASRTGGQYLCAQTEWYYNSRPTWSYALTLTFPKAPYCGSGWYEIEAYGDLAIAGAWRGGSVLSGRHYVNG